MKITPETLKEAESLKAPCVRELLDFYHFVTSNGAYESYVARMVTLNKWNENLIADPVDIITVKELGINKDGELDEKEIAKKDKEVDRVLKFLEKQPILITGSSTIRSMLLPDEIEAMNKDKRLNAQSEDRAFKAKK